mgnify:CR=1 FL=1
MKPTLQCLYEEKLIKALQDELGLTNVNEVPRLEKISINSHVGHYVNERKAAVEDAVDEIGKITGQKASVVFAKKSVANFKVREGEAVGARVTLRGARMWEFLERFIAITCPNIRDFRACPLSPSTDVGTTLSDFRIKQFSLRSSLIKSSARLALTSSS